MPELYHYKATIIRVIDGDSVEVTVNLGFRIAFQQTVRVYAINAPETRSSDKLEKDRGLAAMWFAIGLLPIGSSVHIKSHKPDDKDKFGRWLAEITLPDGTDFATRMLEAGHAKPYFGGSRA